MIEIITFCNALEYFNLSEFLLSNDKYQVIDNGKSWITVKLCP